LATSFIRVLALGKRLFFMALGVNALPQVQSSRWPVHGGELPGVLVLFERQLGLHKAGEGLGKTLRLIPQGMELSGKHGKPVLRRGF